MPDTNVVVIAAPFHITLLPVTKLVPVAVSISGEGIPVGDVFGLMLVSVGAGPMAVPVTVKASVLVVVLSGLVTPTLIVPAVATDDAAMVP